jgi:hypothetical protein
MQKKKSRTVRFDALVKTSGQPEEITLWAKPQEDPEFMRAVKQRRVMTIIQTNVGTKKDFGLIGFFPQEKAAFWVFPKPIDESEESKVIGIKYDKLAAGTPKGPLYRPSKKVQRTRASPQRSSRTESTVPPNKATSKKEKTPRTFSYRANLQISATQEFALEAQASSATEAAQLLKKQAEQMEIDTVKAKIAKKVTRPVRVSSSKRE